MPRNIKIVFEQDYKSFKVGAEYIFEGDLNILSGINGAGKSQLLDAIKEHYTKVYINDILISKRDILKYSFRNNISLPSFGTYDYNTTKEYGKIFISIYNNYVSLHNSYLEAKNNNPDNYYEMLGIAKGTTLEEYCIDQTNYSISFKNNNMNIFSSKNNTTTVSSKFISKTTIAEIINSVKSKHPEDYLKVSDTDIIESIPLDIVLKFQDETIESISRIFTDAARARALEQMECGKKGIKFDNKKWLKTAPWTEINNLFSKLHFNYRFSDDFDYEIPYLKDEPKLFAYEHGITNKGEVRKINDLSDGEKAVLNLAVATYDRKKDTSTKILLLDEYDATLNPSLIKDYYLTIQEYYLQKGIIVLLSTHSPITISLAPEGCKYYEIFRQNNTSPVIREVNSEEYNELKLLQDYYDKIKNPDARLKELEGENQELKKVISIATTPIVITEGKTDWKHIKCAKNQLGNDDNFKFYEYDIQMGDTKALNMLKEQSKISNPNKRIFIFDNDNATTVQEVNEEGKKYKCWGNNVYSFSIPKPNLREDESKISIEHYYPDDILKKEVVFEDGISRRLYCGNDFNRVGLSPKLGKRCDNRNECGSDKIRVLSGSDNEKVFDLSTDDNLVNYALTKNSFFDMVIENNKEMIDFSPFCLILDIIHEIINLD